MAIILNIETATELSSVCISEGKKVLVLRESTVQMTHAQVTTLLIEACLKEAKIVAHEIDAVAVSSGPGSYTALRVGSSIAKGMCYALDKPLIAVDTLQALAWAAAQQIDGDWYCPMIDARRKEVYMAIYNNELTKLQDCEAVILNQDSFSSEESKGKKIIFLGSGSNKFQLMSDRENFVFLDLGCSAVHLVPLAVESFEEKSFESLAYFEPKYLKPPNITIPKKRL